MDFPLRYIETPFGYSELLGKKIPAPYIRRDFDLKKLPSSADLLVSSAGFYRVWVNGTEVTRGLLSPYLSNPDDYLYFDRYDVANHLRVGRNVLAFCLGNGMQNCMGGYIWDFEKAKFRGAPNVAYRLTLGDGEEKTTLDADASEVCHPSPILFDDLRLGEDYDARLEIPNWNLPDFDAAAWTPVRFAPSQRGRRKLCEADPIRTVRQIRPLSITRDGDGWLYDFGENLSGLCRMKIKGTPGQEIIAFYGERLDVKGHFTQSNIHFGHRPEYKIFPQYVQRVRFVCSGREDVHIPSFTYSGFRYVWVEGVTPEQATPDLLTYCVMTAGLPARGSFTTSDPTIASLEAMTNRSDSANFFWFPTDCPHREKNGWTADAALSAE